MYRVIKQSKEDFVVDYPLTDEYVERSLKRYDKMSREDEEDYYDQIHHEGKYADKVYSAVGPWKTRYTVHWMSPDGKDCLLAGNNNLEGAIQSGIDQVEELLDSPWETDERRLLFLENMYIAEGDKVIDTELDDYVDGVMSMISSRMKMKKQKVTSATTMSDMIGEVANAKQELKRFDEEQVKYVRDCYTEVLQAVDKYADDDDIKDTSVDTIKTDYLIGAIEDDLMTEDEFNYIYDLIDIIGQEDAWAVS